MITHVVILGLSDQADQTEALARLRALPAAIPDLVTMRCGAEALAAAGAGNIVLMTEHSDQAGLDGYQQHPAHQDFLAWLRPRLASRAVVDTDDLR